MLQRAYLFIGRQGERRGWWRWSRGGLLGEGPQASDDAAGADGRQGLDGLRGHLIGAVAALAAIGAEPSSQASTPDDSLPPSNISMGAAL